MSSSSEFSKFISAVRELQEISSTVHNEKITLDKNTGEVLDIEPLEVPLKESEWLQ